MLAIYKAFMPWWLGFSSYRPIPCHGPRFLNSLFNNRPKLEVIWRYFKAVFMLDVYLILYTLPWMLGYNSSKYMENLAKVDQVMSDTTMSVT